MNPPVQRRTGHGVCRVPTDGGFALIGIERRTPTSPDSVLVIRTDSLGTLLWRRCYGLRTNSLGFSISALPDGGLLLGGGTRNVLANADSYVVCTDPQGNVRWQRAFDFAGVSEGVPVPIPTRDGHIAVAATVNYGLVNGQFGRYRLAVYKLNGLTGDTLWRRIYGPESYLTSCLALHELADGSLVAAGQWDAIGRGNQPYGQRPADSFILKVCPDGDSLWLRTYAQLTGPNSSNYLRGLSPTPDGGFVGCGFLFTRAPDVGSSDSWVFKVDSAGYLQAGGAPVGVVCRPVGLPGAPAIEGDADGAQLWPNPTAEGTVWLRLPSGAPAGAVVVLRDALGRVVAEQPLAADAPQTALEVRGLAVGVYGWQVRQGRRVLHSGRWVKLP